MIFIENCSVLITDEDVGEINGLLRELSPNRHEFAVTKYDVRRMLGRSFIFLAREKKEPKDRTERGKIVGMVTLIFFYKLTGLMGAVEEVVVNKEYRGKGVGKMLMAATVKEAQLRNVLHIDLTSNPSRKDAWRLYKKVGFILRDTCNFRLTIPNSA